MIYTDAVTKYYDKREPAKERKHFNTKDELFAAKGRKEYVGKSIIPSWLGLKTIDVTCDTSQHDEEKSMIYKGKILINNADIKVWKAKDFSATDESTTFNYGYDFSNGYHVEFYLDGSTECDEKGTNLHVSCGLYDGDSGIGQVEDIAEIWGEHYFTDDEGNQYIVTVEECEIPKYKNWRCNAYHIYGDNSGREYGHAELSEYFIIDGTENGTCIKDFVGDPVKQEHFTFFAGDRVNVMQQTNGTFRVRIAI
jgi:hypothetical protein